jgi:hypothetical protein
VLEVAFQARANLRPRLARILAGSRSGRALLDFGGPGSFGIRVRLGIETREQLRGQLRSLTHIELERVLKELARRLRHGDEGTVAAVT